MDVASCVSAWMAISSVFMVPYEYADSKDGAIVFKGSEGVCDGVPQEITLAGSRVQIDPLVCFVTDVSVVDAGGYVGVEADAICVARK